MKAADLIDSASVDETVDEMVLTPVGLPDPAAVPAPAHPGMGMLQRLSALSAGRGLLSNARRLADLATLVAFDLRRFEKELDAFPQRPEIVGKSASHLVERGGKRLRPLLLCLAARLGKGFDQRALDLAVAVELVHAATLLQDDVVDLADTRRNAPTARLIFGNAASVFAGDWVLIEALRRVERHGLPGLLTKLFDTIEEMIFAESLQLENRGRLALSRAHYFQVVEGKTASVFRWAMAAGAMAGGLREEEKQALEIYGLELGVAFQAIDDLLDLTGDVKATGKQLFTDLREGKMTFPMILALERRPTLRPILEQIIAAGPGLELDAETVHVVVTTLRETRAVEDTLALARDRSARARAQLEFLPQSRARRGLETVAETLVERDV
jgi:octaprenyl-diphosphate synthase